MQNENWNGRWWLVAPALILLLSLAPAAPAAPPAEEGRGVGPRGVWSAVLAATADWWADLLPEQEPIVRKQSQSGSGLSFDPDDKGPLTSPDAGVPLESDDERGPFIDPDG